MQLNAANENTPQPRPAWFDQLLADYDGFIRAKCREVKWDKSEVDDLYCAVLLRAIERWYRYRRDGRFTSWITFLIREEMSLVARKGARREKWPKYSVPQYTPPNQEDTADINLVARSLNPVEYESIVGIALGYTGDEVGADTGITRQRVWQIVEAGRAKLAANDNIKADKVA